MKWGFMKIRLAVAAACLTAAGALVGSPVPWASAAPVQQQPADGSLAVAAPLQLTPGAHTVSLTIPAAAANPAAPDTVQKSVDIRVGKNNCGGFKGTVAWGAAEDIVLEGTLWDNCNYYTPNTTVYLYLSYTDLIGGHNINMDYITGAEKTENIGELYRYTDGSPSSIHVDTCLKWNNGWGCGPSWPPPS
jgi:hypothetical protein